MAFHSRVCDVIVKFIVMRDNIKNRFETKINSQSIDFVIDIFFKFFQCNIFEMPIGDYLCTMTITVK